MKNLLFLGVVALLLFSISAAMSLWLNQSKQADKDAQTEKEKVLPKTGGDPKETTDVKQLPKVTPPPKLDTPPTELAEDRTARRLQQNALVMQDVQNQFDANEVLLRQVANELKNASIKASEADLNATEALKKKLQVAPSDPKNLAKLSEIYEAMTPEGAATILKQLAESGTGKMDEVAQILALMKPRNSARVLEAMNDATLGAQLSKAVLTIRGPSAAPAPSVPKTP